MNFLNTFFGNTQDALRQDLRGFGDQAVANSIRIANSAANRGGASPAALAMAAANASAQQRAALAGQQTQMMQQARLADQAQQNRLIGGGIQALGSLGAMLSDERAKTNIQQDPRAIDQLMESANPAQFQYRAGVPGAGGPPQAGVMAQDLQQSPLGAAMVQEDPQTGMMAVDQNKALSALLAAVARLHDRLSAVEGPQRG